MLTVEYCMDVLMDDMIPREIVQVLAEENTESCKKALERLEFDLTEFGSFDNWRNSILHSIEEWNKLRFAILSGNPRPLPHEQILEFHEEIPIILCA